MTDNKQPDALRLAKLLTADEWPGHMTIVIYARECVAELRRQHTRIAELEARIKTMAEEHADELMVAHLDGRMRAAQPAGAQAAPELTETAVTAKNPAAPVSSFEDSRTQVVYEVLVNDNYPPAGSNEHWEGWKARLIVDALFPIEAPAAVVGDALDAARYRFLAGHCRSTSEHWGGRWSIVVDGPAPKSHDSEDDFDAAIDAARAAQKGKK